MKSPTLSQIKAANPEFFSRVNNSFFGTHNWKKKGNIIWSEGKTGCVFRRWVDFDTLELHHIGEHPSPYISTDINGEMKACSHAQPISLETGRTIGFPVPFDEFKSM